MSDKSNHIREQIDIGGCVDESTDKSDHKTSKSETLFQSIRCLQLNWKLHVYLDALASSYVVLEERRWLTM